MWKQSENIVHRLFSRQINRAPPNTHINKTRQLYENIVPSFTVYDVECPEQLWRCFTNDGQYLICFSRNLHDVLIYRPCWLSYCPAPDSVDELPIKAKKFESYFTLLHQIPLVSGQTGQTELLCKDFFLATENNVYGIFAASTIQDTNPAAATGAVPTVPSVEKTTFFLVRLADGVVTDQRVFHDDYIHLAHNAGVFLHDDLLAVLSVRFQCIHILQVRDGGLFLDVRTIGNFCREDDELSLNSQSQEEAKFQQEQAVLRKARGSVLIAEVPLAPQPSKPWCLKPWNNLATQRRPHPHSTRTALDEAAPLGTASSQSYINHSASIGINGDSQAADIDMLYDGYFRGLFPAENGRSNEASTSQTNGVRWFPAGRVFSQFEMMGSPFDQSASSSRSLYSISGSGSDTASQSFGTTTNPGSSGATTLQESSSYSDDQGPSDLHLRARLSISSSGGLMPASQARAQAEAGWPSGSFAGVSTTSSVVVRDAGVTSTADTMGIHQLSGTRNGVVPHSMQELNVVQGASNGAVAPVREEVLTEGSQILGGLKQRLLSFIMQGIQDENVSPGVFVQILGTFLYTYLHPQSGADDVSGESLHVLTAINVEGDGLTLLGVILRRRARLLQRFYYHFQHYVDLVMWKVQFLDRHHLLIRFGSLDGLLQQRNTDTSQQTSFLAVYNLETTKMLAFYQNSAEEMLQLVEHYYDYFRMALPIPTYMNFISSYGNNIFSREQLRKQKTTCVTSRSYQFSQVIRRTLSLLPFNCQSQSPSAYFDQYLFHYDEKFISANDRHKPCMEHPIKFISRRRPNILKFKINPGLELGANDGHIRRVASFLFHPVFPFVISVQQSFLQATVVNFHFRR